MYLTEKWWRLETFRETPVFWSSVNMYAFLITGSCCPWSDFVYRTGFPHNASNHFSTQNAWNFFSVLNESSSLKILDTFLFVYMKLGCFYRLQMKKRFLVFTDGAHSNSKRSSKEALADCLASLSDMAHTGIDTSLSQLDIPGKSHTTEIFISRKRFKSGTKKKRSFPTIVSRILIITSLKGYFFWDIYKYISDRRKERESFKLFQL